MRTSRTLASLAGLAVAVTLVLAPGAAASERQDPGAAPARAAAVAPAATRTRLRLEKLGGRAVAAHVTVRPTSGPPRGRMELREGSQTIRVFRMRVNDQGSRTVAVRLPEGRHVLRTYFIGNERYGASSSQGQAVRIG